MKSSLGEHDRMLSVMIMPCTVHSVDLAAAKVRVESRGWVSPWVPWHSQAAGKARHWRAPTVGERGSLSSPSGVPSVGSFAGGVYGGEGAPPDNRDHVEVWAFDDGGRLEYDWKAKTYSITLPTGSVAVTVGSTTSTVTDSEVTSKVGATTSSLTNASAVLQSPSIKLVGAVEIEGSLRVTEDIWSGGSITDTTGNTPNHKH